MAGDLGLRHGELHLREQAARTALADRLLRVEVRLGTGDADRVQAELFAQPANVFARHARQFLPFRLFACVVTPSSG